MNAIARTPRVVVMVLATACVVASFTTAPAAQTPAPTVVRVKVSSAEIARAAAATLRNQPRRVVRLPARAVAPALGARQDVVAVKRTTPGGRELATFCDTHPLLVDGASGNVTPRGSITVRGTCFGAARGEVSMLGAFPGGAVSLPVSAWSDNAVTASVPALTGVPDQAVRIRLSRAPGLANPRAATATVAAPIVSEPIAMLFTAARATVIARQDWVVNQSCGHQGATVDNLDSCDAFTAASGAWFNETQAERLVYHVRRNAPAASGEDSWQTRLPAGWTFDRIEFVSSSPGTDVAITPTMNNAFVEWRVSWKTTRVTDGNGPHEEADYLMAVYATGPAGTDRVPR